MNKDTLYFHFANMVLVVIGIFSVQKVVGPVIAALLVFGCVGGFLFSMYIKNSRPPHIDTFIGMLSLASVVVVLSRLYETDISFENLLRIFSTALAWLSLFQAFGLKTEKSYSLLQFISACLLISSVGLALETETVFVVYLAVYLFILIFTMRLGLVCEKQDSGSLIIGDREEVMSLWNQIKIGAIMFSIVLILSAVVYPAVPRFENLSLNWIPSALLGIPDKVPLLKLLQSAEKTIKDANVKKEQRVDDGTKKREAGLEEKIEKKDSKEKKKEKTERFKASDFKANVDAFKIESLEIKADKKEAPLDRQVLLGAELKLTDGSTIPATKLVDWKVTGTADVSIDKDGRLTAKEEGNVTVSASYMGTFSNDLSIKITEPIKPKPKKSILFYIFLILLWLLVLALIVIAAIVFARAYKLSELRKTNPKDFIKELYNALCNAFKVYGMPKLNYTAYREFYNAVKEFLSARPEPMQSLTEGFMEARFSTHEISAGHSDRTIDLFHEVKDVVLQREAPNIFWKNILFRLSILDVLLLPKRR